MPGFKTTPHYKQLGGLGGETYSTLCRREDGEKRSPRAQIRLPSTRVQGRSREQAPNGHIHPSPWNPQPDADAREASEKHFRLRACSQTPIVIVGRDTIKRTHPSRFS